MNMSDKDHKLLLDRLERCRQKVKDQQSLLLLHGKLFDLVFRKGKSKYDAVVQEVEQKIKDFDR